MINEKLIMSVTEDEAKAAFESANDQMILYANETESIDDALHVALYQYNLLELKLFKLIEAINEKEEYK